VNKSELKALIKEILMEEKKRDYKKEYNDYHGSSKQKKNRAQRNAARRTLEADGRVSKGDGKDVDHKRKIKSGGSNSKSNLRVRSRSSNRADNKHKG